MSEVWAWSGKTPPKYALAKEHNDGRKQPVYVKELKARFTDHVFPAGSHDTQYGKHRKQSSPRTDRMHVDVFLMGAAEGRTI